VRDAFTLYAACPQEFHDSKLLALPLLAQAGVNLAQSHYFQCV